MSNLPSGLAALAGAVIILAVGCGSQTPPPNPSGSLQPSGSPAVTGPAPSGSATNPPGPVESPGSDLLAPEPQTAFPGLYLPAGFLAQGTDHFALIQAPFDCPTLTGVLAAGQWTLADRAFVPIPTAAPGQSPQPMPDLNLPEWLLLRWADDTAIARIGGDQTSCLAQVWRLARSQYVAHGAIESTGEASALQVMCAAGDGVAEIGAMNFGADGTFFSFQTTVPLRVGRHSLDAETELTAGPRGPTIAQAFDALYGGAPTMEEPDIPGIEPYYPAGFETGSLEWQGSMEVTSIDPLLGQIEFEDLTNEAGEELTLTTPFRCDLPSRQLTRAAEAAANATPSPAPSPTPAPGVLSVTIATGPHAGTQQLTSPDLTCNLGLFGPGDWTASYSAAEPVSGDVQSLMITVDANGKADVFMIMGDDFEDDWFNTDSAQATVTDNGASVDIAVTGRAAGTDFTIEFLCNDVARF